MTPGGNETTSQQYPFANALLSNCAETAAPCATVPLARGLAAVEKRLLDREYPRLPPGALLEKSDEAAGRRRRAVDSARTRYTDSRTAETNPVRMIEVGRADPDDDYIRERLAANRLAELTAAPEIDSPARQPGIRRKTITADLIDRIGLLLRSA